jgi:hypothetical protein
VLGAIPAVAVLSPIPAGAGPVGSATRSAACAAPGLTAFSFQPRRVMEGQNTKLRAVITNCTDRSFSGSLETFGVLVCEVVDPIAIPVKVGPGSVAVSSVVYTAPHCAGLGAITGRLLNRRGHIVSTKVAMVAVIPPPPA